MFESSTGTRFRYETSSVEIGWWVIGILLYAQAARRPMASTPANGCRPCLVAETSKIIILVSMKLSEKFQVPDDVALLYDFVNSVDLRRYLEHGVAHDPGDELATSAQLQDWLQARGLLKRGDRVS